MVVREDVITEYEREWMGGGMYGTEHALRLHHLHIAICVQGYYYIGSASGRNG